MFGSEASWLWRILICANPLLLPPGIWPTSPTSKCWKPRLRRTAQPVTRWRTPFRPQSPSGPRRPLPARRSRALVTWSRARPSFTAAARATLTWPRRSLPGGFRPNSPEGGQGRGIWWRRRKFLCTDLARRSSRRTASGGWQWSCCFVGVLLVRILG